MKAAHRHHASGHEHEFEPQPGLPETLPAGETLLWQGSARLARAGAPRLPRAQAGALLRACCWLRAALRAGRRRLRCRRRAARHAAAAGRWPPSALGLVALLAWLSARTTVYTLTDQRVVMRIGIVLTLTFNLPLRRIAAAGLRRDADGTRRHRR